MTPSYGDGFRMKVTELLFVLREIRQLSIEAAETSYDDGDLAERVAQNLASQYTNVDWLVGYFEEQDRLAA
jgi:hypothetical protein